MFLDPWFPVGFTLPDGAAVHTLLFAETDWQIYQTMDNNRALVVSDKLARCWLDAGLIEEGVFTHVPFGKQQFWEISCDSQHILCPVSAAKFPSNKVEALSFALALKATRAIDAVSPLQDALFIEKFSRLLPTYTTTVGSSDDVVLGYWLSGGINIPATSFRRLRHAVSRMDPVHLKEVVQAAGLTVTEIIPQKLKAKACDERTKTAFAGQAEENECIEMKPDKIFELAGRPELAAFFNEHIIDIILHRDRYEAFSITFPAPVVLHGPPGCGKTFAVERLIEFLGWPDFRVDASSIASPYIHESGKKIAQMFDKATVYAPSVLVIDEMEAFLADRDMGSGHHRVEEMAEFLRRIPEAAKNEVLIIAMTNRIEMIDPAILRRGRFDHVIKVDLANEKEVHALLGKLLSPLPKAADVNIESLARKLAGRPLSDIASVVREGARLAARSGKTQLDQDSLLSALRLTPIRKDGDGEKGHRIGFI